MKKVMLVFGTRPEAIKMCPLVNELKGRKNIQTVVCVTGQHRQMLDQVLEVFNVVPDYDLSIMKDKQTLFDITTSILSKIKIVLENEKPDVVLVHGDTSTTFVTALACFYLQIPVGHVEAGLRTYNVYSPYPEEFNRQAVSIISKYNFAPTELSKNNLIKEGKDSRSIYVTGNTAIDALKTTVKKEYTHKELEWAKGSRLIMITAHRRENLGTPMRNMFNAIVTKCNEVEDRGVGRGIHDEIKNVKIIGSIWKTKYWAEDWLTTLLGYIDEANTAIDGSSLSDERKALLRERVLLESLFPRYVLYKDFQTAKENRERFVTDCSTLGVTLFRESEGEIDGDLWS
jgi:UDP-N-acetylglucosamine 2-epimerase